jgi:membrane protein YdbS with pleckstrin-like domain
MVVLFSFLYVSLISVLRNTRQIDFYLFTVQYPRREEQMTMYRWLFVVSYLLISVLLSVILIHVSGASNNWSANVVFDIILCVIFILYCRNIHYKSVFHVYCLFLFHDYLFCCCRIFMNHNGVLFQNHDFLIFLFI